MAADPSVYDDDPDEHLFDGIEDEDMKYLDDDEEDSSDSTDTDEAEEKQRLKNQGENQSRSS